MDKPSLWGEIFFSSVCASVGSSPDQYCWVHTSLPGELHESTELQNFKYSLRKHKGNESNASGAAAGMWLVMNRRAATQESLQTWSVLQTNMIDTFGSAVYKFNMSLFQLKFNIVLFRKKGCTHVLEMLPVIDKISNIQPDESSKITLIKIHCTWIIGKIKISYTGYNNKSNIVQLSVGERPAVQHSS